MRYNKTFQLEKGGHVHNRSVTVSDELFVETKLLPKAALPLLVKELSSIARKNEYKRINPYKFDDKSERHVYIETQGSRKLIIRNTHGGNFKIPEGTFLYDVLDYFVSIELLDWEYNLIGNVTTDIALTVVDGATGEEVNLRNPYVKERDKAEEVNRLLDEYNDCMFLFKLFGDEEYKIKAESALTSLKKNS